jgi:hypothetical protein
MVRRGRGGGTRRARPILGRFSAVFCALGPARALKTAHSGPHCGALCSRGPGGRLVVGLAACGKPGEVAPELADPSAHAGRHAPGLALTDLATLGQVDAAGEWELCLAVHERGHELQAGGKLQAQLPQLGRVYMLGTLHQLGGAVGQLTVYRDNRRRAHAVTARGVGSPSSRSSTATASSASATVVKPSQSRIVSASQLGAPARASIVTV